VNCLEAQKCCWHCLLSASAGETRQERT
jgi:hypothetical protein